MVSSSFVSPEQKKFLQGRFRKAAAQQPDLKGLKKLLLKLGGEYLVAPSSSDADIPALLGSGFVMYGPIRLKEMTASNCHGNIAAVWKRRKPALVAIATGYALSDDGLWRQHSWGLLHDGVLETTEARTQYFGILLHGSEADRFASRNLPD